MTTHHHLNCVHRKPKVLDHVVFIRSRKKKERKKHTKKKCVAHLQESPSVNIHWLQLLLQGCIPGPLFKELLLKVEQLAPEEKSWFNNFSSCIFAK